MFVNKNLVSLLKIGLVSDAADVSLWAPVSMESFHDATIQTVKKSHSPLSQPRVQDHGELRSARTVSRQPLEVRRADADEWKFPLVTTATTLLWLPSISEKMKNRRHPAASLYFIGQISLHRWRRNLKQANKCFIKWKSEPDFSWKRDVYGAVWRSEFD